jgi:hypothetical protein
VPLPLLLELQPVQILGGTLTPEKVVGHQSDDAPLLDWLQKNAVGDDSPLLDWLQKNAVGDDSPLLDWLQ